MEQSTEKIFYGVEDIKNASDVIIVEGEIDKLSMEEAGFLNCVSVPDGAPPQISTKDVPSPDKANLVDWLKNMVGNLRSEEVIDLDIETRPPTRPTMSQSRRDPMSDYKFQRVPFLEEQVRKINEGGGLMSLI